MKSAFVFIAILAVGFHSLAFAQNCNLLVKDGSLDQKGYFTSLSEGWANFLIGSDLAKEFVSQNGESARVQLVTIDHFNSTGNAHGNHVEDLIFGSKFGATSPDWVNETCVELQNAGPSGSSSTDLSEIIRLVDQANPQIVNQSWSRKLSRDNYIRISQDSTVVVSAGNEYPHEIDSAYQNAQLVMVGSVAPEGTISGFSNEGDGITVLAPSDQWLQTSVGRFGGTSGAAPLVTGSLINGIKLLNIKKLPGSQAQAWLKMTSIPYLGAVSGPGILNAYRLARFIKCMNSSTTQSSDQCNDFKGEALKWLNSAKIAFSHADCNSLSKSLDAARRSFLLNPSPDSAQLLEQILDKESFPREAMFFRLWRESLGQKKVIIRSLLQKISLDDFIPLESYPNTFHVTAKTAMDYEMVGLVRSGRFLDPAFGDELEILRLKKHDLIWQAP